MCSPFSYLWKKKYCTKIRIANPALYRCRTLKNRQKPRYKWKALWPNLTFSPNYYQLTNPLALSLLLSLVRLGPANTIFSPADRRTESNRKRYAFSRFRKSDEFSYSSTIPFRLFFLKCICNYSSLPFF